MPTKSRKHSKEKINQNTTHPNKSTIVDLALAHTPQEIVKHLNEYIVGKSEAKISLAVAVYYHYMSIKNQRRSISYH